MSRPILERTSVLVAAQQLLEQAASGRGGSLFVAGEAGLGKTTVLSHVVEAATARFRIGVGRGDVAEAVLPFGLVSQAFDQLLGTVDILSLDPADADASARSVLYRMLGHLRRAAHEPVLLALDDANWADPDSLLLIRLLCRRITQLPVALVSTIRPWPPQALRMADELVAHELAAIEHLAPLSNEAALGIVRGLVSKEVAAEAIQQVVGLCGGNPFLLEMAASALQSGEAVRPESRAAPTTWTRKLLISQLSGLTEQAHQYLRVASVLGRRFRSQIAADIAGFSPREAAAGLRELAEAGLVRDVGEGWAEFSHALVRQAIYDLVEPAQASLHEAAFRAVVARRLSPAEAAEHAIIAGLAGDDQAIEALTRAGRQALAAGAVETARRYLEAGADLAGERVRIGLLFDIGRAQTACGDNSTAIAVYESLLARHNLAGSERLAALRQLSRAAFHDGQVEQAGAWLDQAIRESTDANLELTVAAMVEQGAQIWQARGPVAAMPTLTRARELAVPATPAAIAAEHVWGFCAYLMGNPDGLAAVEAAAKATELTAWSNPEGAQWWDARVAYAYLFKGSSRFSEMTRIFESVLGTDTVKGEPMMIFQALFEWVEGLCDLGRLAEALALSGRLVEAAELVPFGRRWAAAERALVLLDLGRLHEAASWCDGLAEPADDGRYVLYVGHLPCGRAALRRGDVQAACAIFARMEEMASELGIRDPCIVPWAGDAITSYIACGRDTEAVRVIESVKRWIPTSPAEWPKIIVATGRAALAERDGDTSAAEAYFKQALDLHDALEMPIAQAQTLTDYGTFLIRTQRPAQARPVFARAIALAESCGAAWHARQAHIGHRRAGGRSRKVAPGSLSPQEAAVARLARNGKTNREIAEQLYLSVNTVQTHLRHVYQKLAITRRWQLIDRPGLDQPTQGRETDRVLRSSHQLSST